MEQQLIHKCLFFFTCILPSKTDHQEKIGLIMKTNNVHIIVAIYRGITRTSKGEIYKPYNNVPLQICKIVPFPFYICIQICTFVLIFYNKRDSALFMLMSCSSYSYIFIMNKKKDNNMYAAVEILHN